MNPQITFNINLAADTARASEAGPGNSIMTGSLPVPSDINAMAGATGGSAMSLPTPEAASDAGRNLPTPMDAMGAASDQGGQALPTPMDALRTAESASGQGGDRPPTPFDAMESHAKAEAGKSTEPISQDQTDASEGPTEGGLPPGLDELELSGGGPQGDEQKSTYNKREKK